MVKRNEKSDTVKATRIYGMAYEQEPPIEMREYDTLYNCANCGKIYRVYRGKITCSCQASRGMGWE